MRLASVKSYLEKVRQDTQKPIDCVSEWTLKDDENKVICKGLVFLAKNTETGKRQACHKVKFQKKKVFVDGNESQCELAKAMVTELWGYVQ